MDDGYIPEQTVQCTVYINCYIKSNVSTCFQKMLYDNNDDGKYDDGDNDGDNDKNHDKIT